MSAFTPVSVCQIVTVLLPPLDVVPDFENVTPLLATPSTVTTTGPVVTPSGTVVSMRVPLQLVGVAGVPLKLTELEP